MAEDSGMKKTAFILAAVVVMLLVAMIVYYLYGGAQSPRRKAVIAVSADPSSALVMIAHEKGFFRQQGLEVSLLTYSSGRAALKAVFEKNADLATVADTVLMLAALENKKIATIATIAESDRNHRIIALREYGISQPGDLAGKKIGVTQGTSGEYFLYIFLLFQGIEYRKIQPVNLPPEEMLKALTEHRVDAVATWYPTAGKVQDELGSRAVSFEEHSYVMTWNMVGERSFMDEHRVTVQKVLKGLLAAKVFIWKEPEESKSITSRYSGTDPALLDRIWSSYFFDVRLREVTLVNLEDQARWALQHHAEERRMPDFQEYVYPAGLQAVDPAAVSVTDDQP